MAELYRGRHIFLAQEFGMREVVVPILFPFDSILEAKSAHGCSPGFENKAPKFLVKLTNDRRLWLLGKFSDFERQWEQYLRGEDTPCPCPNCTVPLAFPPLPQN